MNVYVVIWRKLNVAFKHLIQQYFVSGEQYGAAYYPPYVSGGGFVMTTSLALALAKAMSAYFNTGPNKVIDAPPLPIDDAFLGVCLQNAGLTSGTRVDNWVDTVNVCQSAVTRGT